MTVSLKPALSRATNQSEGTPPAASGQSLDLALQGGLAASAYLWGALDALLDSEPIKNGELYIRRITGGSGGITQGAIIAHALNRTGNPLQAAHDQNIYWKAIMEAHRPDRAIQHYTHSFFNASFRAASAWMSMSPALLLSSGEDGTHDTVLQSHRHILNEIITHPEYLQQGPVELFVSAVRKQNRYRSLTPGNIEPVIFSGNALSLEAILASTALGEQSPVIIDGVPYWDPAFHPTANPCLAPLYDNPADHALIIAVDDVTKEIHFSPHDQRIECGHVFAEAKNLPGAEVLSLPYNKGLDEKARLDFSVASLEGLRRLGFNDLLAWIRKFEQNHRRLPPEITGTYETQVA